MVHRLPNLRVQTPGTLEILGLTMRKSIHLGFDPGIGVYRSGTPLGTQTIWLEMSTPVDLRVL